MEDVVLPAGTKNASSAHPAKTCMNQRVGASLERSKFHHEKLSDSTEGVLCFWSFPLAILPERHY